MKQLFILVFFALLTASCCPKEEPLSDCLGVHFNDGLYEQGPEDSSTKLESYEIDGNCLVLDLTYSGGCAEHTIDLAATGWQKTDPPAVEAKIVHENLDPCDALLRETISFDLSDLQYADNPELIIKLKGFDGLIIHNFTD
jgi:hypothetical protein